MKYCSQCGAPVIARIPQGEDRPRFVCGACQTIHYENPKMVVGCIPQWEDRILLCRRAIEPRLGKWTLPAGFLENGELVSEGAVRETLEEAGARVTRLIPYTMFSLPFINQVHFMFLATLLDCNFLPGTESLEVELFKKEDIPWHELSFHVVRETLIFFFRDRASGVFSFHMGELTPSGDLLAQAV